MWGLFASHAIRVTRRLLVRQAGSVLGQSTRQHHWKRRTWRDRPRWQRWASSGAVIAGGFAFASSTADEFGSLRAVRHETKTVSYARARELLRDGAQEIRSVCPSAGWPPIRLDPKSRESKFFPLGGSSSGKDAPFVVHFDLERGVDLSDVIHLLSTQCGPLKVQETANNTWSCTQLTAIEAGSMTVLICTRRMRDASAAMDLPPGVSLCRVYIEKNGDFTEGEIKAMLDLYQAGNKQIAQSASKLNRLGLTIYEPDAGISFKDLAGYGSVKDAIRSTIILPLKHPDVYERVSAASRTKKDSVRPKACLFMGPPGTGKTTSARILAGECDIPMIYVPLETILTKYYGESESRLRAVFEAAEGLSPAILFLDEIDSLATSRGGNMHEATRRVLGVLLREIEGFHGKSKSIVIGATNRASDLDDALLSRFDLFLEFPLPATDECAEIFGFYAKHLPVADRNRLGEACKGFSGRDIRDVAADAERAHAQALIQRGATKSVTGPPVDMYLKSIEKRLSGKGTIDKDREASAIRRYYQ